MILQTKDKATTMKIESVWIERSKRDGNKFALLVGNSVIIKTIREYDTRAEALAKAKELSEKLLEYTNDKVIIFEC